MDSLWSVPQYLLHPDGSRMSHFPAPPIVLNLFQHVRKHRGAVQGVFVQHHFEAPVAISCPLPRAAPPCLPSSSFSPVSLPPRFQ
eukprot:2250288-Karenia_brevis.AAC.1